MITVHAKKPAGKPKFSGLLRSDPTLTLTLRNKLAGDLTGRIGEVRDTIHQALDYSTGWPDKTKAGKIKEMRRWLDWLVEEKVTRTQSPIDKFWAAKLVKDAHIKGVARSFDNINFMQGKESLYKKGYKDQYLNSVRMQYGESVKLLIGMCQERVRSITDDFKTQALEAVRKIIIQGGSDEEIKDAISEVAESIIKSKVERDMGDVIITSHAEGQLDGFEHLGVEQVGVRAEWVTAGDDRVCTMCKYHEGNVYRIDEARGLIPLHPRCRCCWFAVRVARNDRFRKVVSVAAKLAKTKKS